jgi:recombination protein RecA
VHNQARPRDARDAADKSKAIDSVLLQIEKQFGKGAIMKLGEASHRMAVDTIPTGSIALDIALGVGGVPRGRVLEIFGPEASGKTTLVQHIIAEAQRMGGTCAIIDAEHALDPDYARRLGVDVDNLFISQPDSGEQALEIAEALVRSAAFDVVAIDSVAALVPRAELEGEMGDSHVGLQARLMSQALRKLTGSISRSRTCLIFTNQLREKIGVMFGNPETTTGGRALKFYASVRLDIRRIDAVKMGTDVVGSHVKVKVVKNKVAPPFRVAEFDIMYNEGISREGSLLDLGVELGFVKKSGAFFSYAETRLGQGRENAREFLKKNAELASQIEGEIRREMQTGGKYQPETPVVETRISPVDGADQLAMAKP